MRTLASFILLIYSNIFILSAQQADNFIPAFDINLYFDSDRASIRVSEENKISQITDSIKKYSDYSIKLKGHTDATASEAYNMQLSKRRVMAVHDALLNAGVNKKNISIEYFGERNPVAENESEKGKQSNRRVEIEVYKSVAQKPIVAPPPPKPAAKHQLLTGTVTDVVTAEQIPAKLIISWKKNSDVINMDSIRTAGGKYSYSLRSILPFEISAFSEGYLYKTKEFDPATSDSTIYIINFQLQPIVTGELFEAENIYFFPNSPEIRPNSRPELDKLYNLMINNPQLKIEIQGHVNWPSTYPGPIDQITEQLSEDRARSVFNFLTVQGIAPDRMTYVGMGNSKMIYPHASTQEEYYRNMRVEIKILDQ